MEKHTISDLNCCLLSKSFISISCHNGTNKSGSLNINIEQAWNFKQQKDVLLVFGFS